MMENTINRDVPVEEHPYYRDYLSAFNHDLDLVLPKGCEKCLFSWDLLVRLIVGSFMEDIVYKLEIDQAWALNPQGRPRVHLVLQIKGEQAPDPKPLDEYSFVQALEQIKVFSEEQIFCYEMAAEDDEDSEYEEKKAKRLRRFELEVKLIMANAKVFMLI